MTVSVIVAIILGWLLVNMWLTHIMLELNKEFISGWYDLGCLLFSSVVSPITIYVVGRLYYWIRKMWRVRNEN
jgi:hypothetical protein